MRKLKVILPYVILIIVIDLVISSLWFRFVTLTEKGPNISTAEAAVVLMGDVAGEFADIGPETIDRLNYALKLKDEDRIKKFLCVGGYRPSRKFFGAKIMQRYLIEHGIEPFDVLIEPNSYDTKTNLKYASSIIREQKWESVIIVSSPLHIHRVRTLKELEYLKGIKLQFASYSYDDIKAELGFFQKWKKVHYEWASYILGSMPKGFYEWFVRLVREQN